MANVNRPLIKAIVASIALTLGSGAAYAACDDISRTALENAANAVVDANSSGGFNLPMWVTVVDETGKVCHVVNTARDTNSGPDIGNDSWLGSRVISAQKANTANAFSLNGFAISTANLYGLTQPGGSLYGLQHSNPVDASHAYDGSPNTWGKNADSLKNKRIGGVNVFGGGLALYNASGAKVGAIGVSGDTSCTDHAVAWKIRAALDLNHVPTGLHADLGGIGDELVYEEDGVAALANSTRHPTCPNAPTGIENGVISDPD